jgi:hypothetical protein
MKDTTVVPNISFCREICFANLMSLLVRLRVIMKYTSAKTSRGMRKELSTINKEEYIPV